MQTHFDREHVSLSPYHLHFTSFSRPQFKLLLDLQCIVKMEEESGFLRSHKIVLHLSAASGIITNSFNQLHLKPKLLMIELFLLE